MTFDEACAINLRLTLVRLAVVVGLLTIVALADLALRRGRATRWREYIFWAATGLFGASINSGLDMIASLWAPEEFKNTFQGTTSGLLSLFGGGGLPFHLGFTAGILVGGAYLMANNPRPDLPQLRYRSLAKLLIFPIACVLGLVILYFCLAGSRILPGPSAPGIRWSLAFGCLLGTILGLAAIWRRRTRPAAERSIFRDSTLF
jgi:hypothetical protein